MAFKEGNINPFEDYRRQHETYAHYFKNISSWMSAAEKATYEDANTVLAAIRGRVNAHPLVEVVADSQPRIAGVGEYDRVDIALASKIPVYTETEMNNLALDVFEGFYDPEEYHHSSKPMGHGLRAPQLPDLLLSDMQSRYERQPDFLDQELGFKFPTWVKRLPLAFAEQRTSYNISGVPSVSVPGEALEELAKPDEVLYKPFLWRSIVVTLFPDANVAELKLAWEKDKAEKKKQDPGGFKIVGIWEIPKLKDWGIDSISHGLHFELYRKWREGVDLVQEYFPSK